MAARVLLAIGAMLSAATASQVRKLQDGWYECNLQNSVDYEGHDFKNVPGPSNNCCWSCAETSGCVAWSWSTHQNGTCWLKNGVGNILVNPNVQSARVLYHPYEEAYCRAFIGIDFVGNDLSNVQKPQFGDCCEECRKTPGCRAYTWSDYAGGTCWLKSKRDKLVVKQGATSADGIQTDAPLFAPAFVIEEGVDYDDHDIGSALADDPLKCRQLCSKFQDAQRCKAFAWNKNQGGTCWFKSQKGNVISKSGVTSGYRVDPMI